MNVAHSRTQLAKVIGEKIIRQELPAGRSIGEVALATELGVSRTPVREALLGLESDGLVRAQRGRGFIVQKLCADEARQTYPIIAALERLAVEASGPPAEALIERLVDLNSQLSKADSSHERMQIDAEWHHAITSGCNNPRLISLIESAKQTVLKYEYAYLKISNLRDKSIEEHQEISALYTQDPKRAGECIELHWLRGMHSVLHMWEGAEE